MYQFTLWISGLAADLVYKQAAPRTVTVQKVITEERLDPRGLVRNDIKFLNSKVPPVSWKADTTIEEVAYAQGQQDLIRFIETRVIGRRTDAS